MRSHWPAPFNGRALCQLQLAREHVDKTRECCPRYYPLASEGAAGRRRVVSSQGPVCARH